jgi:DNA repair exonuclease SbcCD ATPase subunit
MSTRREKVEELLADILPRIEELKAEALAEIEAIRADAAEKVSRYEGAREELDDVEAEISILKAEREELPNKAYRAHLDGEQELEARLKERYQNLRPEIEALEDRRASLEEEMAKLDGRSSSGPPPHRNDASRRQYGRVAGTAAEERRALELLKERLSKALDDAVGPVVRKHEDYRGLVAAWGEERKWDPEQKEWLDKMKAAQGGGR